MTIDKLKDLVINKIDEITGEEVEAVRFGPETSYGNYNINNFARECYRAEAMYFELEIRKKIREFFDKLESEEEKPCCMRLWNALKLHLKKEREKAITSIEEAKDACTYDVVFAKHIRAETLKEILIAMADFEVEI